MNEYTATVAVTGMNATDNPAPGVAVCRSLRSDPAFRGKLVGLGYDALDPGFYDPTLIDGAAILPYPSAGKDALLAHLERIRGVLGVDVLLPTLDSELRGIARVEPELHQLGIRAFTPRLEALEAVAKVRLNELGETTGCRVPESEPVAGTRSLPRIIERLGLPLVIKGPYYGATIAHSLAQAQVAHDRYVSSWGVPIIAQRYVGGEEYNVAGLGDGRGNLVGGVPMRKMALTDQGKGWAGVTIDGTDLVQITERVVGGLRWRGGLEVELIKERKSGDLYVVEINPRFPAWVYLATAAGQNLPSATVRLALGLPVEPLPRHRVGVQFVRISLDQITNLETFGNLTCNGFLPLSA